MIFPNNSVRMLKTLLRKDISLLKNNLIHFGLPNSLASLNGLVGAIHVA